MTDGSLNAPYRFLQLPVSKGSGRITALDTDLLFREQFSLKPLQSCVKTIPVRILCWIPRDSVGSGQQPSGKHLLLVPRISHIQLSQALPSRIDVISVAHGKSVYAPRWIRPVGTLHLVLTVSVGMRIQPIEGVLL